MKRLFLAILFFIVPALVLAQRMSNEDIQAFKVSYITQKLDLSAEEARVFWPIYNDWEREKNALRKERMQKMISHRKIDEIENLSDTEVQSLIANELDFKQRELNIEKKYYNILRTSLPIKLVGKYYRAQETFKRELLNRYRENRPK